MADRVATAESGILKKRFTRTRKKGTTQHEMTVVYDWCKGCEICITFCPKDCFDISSINQPLMSRMDLCTKCMICVYRCPDYCIDISDLDGDLSLEEESGGGE